MARECAQVRTNSTGGVINCPPENKRPIYFKYGFLLTFREKNQNVKELKLAKKSRLILTRFHQQTFLVL